MKKFSDISIGALILFIVILVVRIYFIHTSETKPASIDELDLNRNGVVSRAELHYILKNHIQKKQPDIESVMRSASSGALRGCLSGFLIGGTEGALTGAVVFAIINPIVSSLEHLL